jgi:hypothetical protein
MRVGGAKIPEVLAKIILEEMVDEHLAKRR